MKIAFISDIHGNYEALKSVLHKIDEMGIKSIFCAGDVAGYYCQINEVCTELQKRNIPCVMGNHDWYLAGGGFCPRSRSVMDCLLYQRKIISKNNLDWLKTFSINMHIGDVHMVHGGWADPIDEYLKPSNEYFEKIEGRFFVSGHTHVQRIDRYKNGKIYCNPGSVGQPRDGNPKAAFSTFNGSDFEMHRVGYDMHAIFECMEKAGFNDYYYGGLKTGSKNLRKLKD